MDPRSAVKLDFDRIDPELRPVIDALPPALAQIDRDNIVAVREAMSEAPIAAPETPVEIEAHSVGTSDGAVAVYHYFHPDKRAAARGTPRPCLLWIHGGGYILGSAQDDRARVIAESLDCSVLSVDYRLAPEDPFPAGPEDCHAALSWAVERSSALGIDPTRIAIGGASAGGGMAAGLALLNRDRGGPAIAFQLLLYPMIDNLHDTPSGQISDHPVWNRQTSFNAWAMYLDGEPGVDASPYAAAARASDLAGLPPAYICVGAEDLFRDEDIEYARRLMAAGVACELCVYPGLFHGADSFLPQAAVSRRLELGFLHALAHRLGLDFEPKSPSA